MILIDSNVLVATLVGDHKHNGPSTEMVISSDPLKTVLAAHTIAETYAVLTRPKLSFRMTAQEAWSQIEPIAKRFRVAALTPPQTLDAIRRFSALGTGPRLYDFLIGVTGETYGAHTIVTWNTRDFAGLFPQLRIVTPEALA